MHHVPSSTTKGIAPMRIEPKQANPAPNRFNKLYIFCSCFIFPTVSKINAIRIRLTPDELIMFANVFEIKLLEKEKGTRFYECLSEIIFLFICQ